MNRGDLVFAKRACVCRNDGLVSTYNVNFWVSGYDFKGYEIVENTRTEMPLIILGPVDRGGLKNEHYFYVVTPAGRIALCRKYLLDERQ